MSWTRLATTAQTHTRGTAGTPEVTATTSPEAAIRLIAMLT
jgi:hypothetical protein